MLLAVVAAWSYRLTAKVWCQVLLKKYIKKKKKRLASFRRTAASFFWSNAEDINCTFCRKNAHSWQAESKSRPPEIFRILPDVFGKPLLSRPRRPAAPCADQTGRWTGTPDVTGTMSVVSPRFAIWIVASAAAANPSQASRRYVEAWRRDHVQVPRNRTNLQVIKPPPRYKRLNQTQPKILYSRLDTIQ